MPAKKRSSSRKKEPVISNSLALQISLEIWMVSTFVLLLSVLILLNQTFFLNKIFTEQKNVITSYQQKIRFMQEAQENGLPDGEVMMEDEMMKVSP